MSLQKIEKYINILLYLYSNEKTTIIKVVKEFHMKYSTVITLFKRWINEHYLKRIKIKEIKPGQDQYYYEITSKGINYLKNLTVKINSLKDFQEKE